MGNAESVPVVSQLLSAGQAMGGDVEGARRTQERFSRECPLISQIRSSVEAAMDDNEAALRTQMDFAANASNMLDAMPGVGHTKAAIHDACGDRGGAEKARGAANLTIACAVCGVLEGGVAGGVVGGMVGGARLGGKRVVSAAIEHPRSIATEGWICFEDTAADPGQNAESVPATDISHCQHIAEQKGYGGFAIWNGVAYFRRRTGPELHTRLQKRGGVTFHLYVPSPPALDEAIDVAHGETSDASSSSHEVAHDFEILGVSPSPWPHSRSGGRSLGPQTRRLGCNACTVLRLCTLPVIIDGTSRQRLSARASEAFRPNRGQKAGVPS